MDDDEIFIHIRINATRAGGAGWGDTQYAEGMARAIRALPGCGAGLLFRGETPPPTDAPAALLQIIGPHLEEPAEGLPNMLWMISPPNLGPIGMLGRYQAVFCASRWLCETLTARGLAASYLPQATEPEHFHPDRQAPEERTDLVFVGGFAPRVDRRMVFAAIRAGHAPQIWGPGWGGVIAPELWRGERLDYAGLAAAYAGARIVLNSHMPAMAALGFMSNRSFDALASGAQVLSDRIAGFDDPAFPELRQFADPDQIGPAITDILDRPPDPAARLDLHRRAAERYGFAPRARVVVARARALLAAGQRPPAAFRPAATPVGTAAPPVLSDPARSAADAAAAVVAAAAEIQAIANHLQDPGAARPLPPARAVEEGVIHPLMADLREIQAIALRGATPGDNPRLAEIAAGARRLAEVMADHSPPLGMTRDPALADRVLATVLRNRPLWAHSPEGFDRDEGKAALPLWPRRDRPRMDRPVGVFLHLYYAELAPVFAERLAHIAPPSRIYVSTDTAAKAAAIAAALPAAEISVLPNRGRDIWPKLYGFAGAHDRHDVVLHLHGKKSLHSGRLDAWLGHILDCLLGGPEQVNRILSLFADAPRLGMVAPVIYRDVLSAAHWGANRDIARELAARISPPPPLPDEDALQFPVGSMFWARPAALRPLLDLDLRPGHFPPEAGQVDGTLAHAIERMLGVVCRATGHHFLPVVPAGSKLHRKYQRPFAANRELRQALDEGLFAPTAVKP